MVHVNSGLANMEAEDSAAPPSTPSKWLPVRLNSMMEGPTATGYRRSAMLISG